MVSALQAMALAVRNEYAILLPCFFFFFFSSWKLKFDKVNVNFWILKTNQIRKQKEEGNIIPHIWFVKYFKVENSEKRLQAMAEQITCLLVQANWSNTSWLAAETDIFTYLCVTCTEAAFIHGISHNMHCRRSEENWQICKSNTGTAGQMSAS